jgi:hypothetical protein
MSHKRVRAFAEYELRDVAVKAHGCQWRIVWKSFSLEQGVEINTCSASHSINGTVIIDVI